MKQFFSIKGASFSFFVLLLSTMMFLGLTACGGKTSDTPAAKYKHPDRAHLLKIIEKDQKSSDLGVVIGKYEKYIADLDPTFIQKNPGAIINRSGGQMINADIYLDESILDMNGFRTPVIEILYSDNNRKVQDLTITIGVGEFAKTLSSGTELSVKNFTLTIKKGEYELYKKDFSDIYYN
ncbi:MAG: hypothetical protein LBO74_12390 [Candidatus Symbiothrix sp.]|jgi:hypothetical protein|nr:hypothetical protein [Candidatus Symbiothrix sp.]